MTFGSPTFWRFLRYGRPYRFWITGSIICGILKFTLALMIPWALGFLIDHVILEDIPGEQKMQRLWWMVLLLLAVYIFRLPITYYRSYFAELAGNRIIFDIRDRLYLHIQRLSLDYHARHRTGETTSRVINDINTSQGILDRGVMSVLVDFIFLSGVVVFLFIWDWELAAVSLFTLPAYAMTFGILNPRLRRAAQTVQAQMSELSGEVNEKMSGLAVVQSFVRERTERRLFFHLHREYFFGVMKRVRLQVWLTTLGEFLTMLGPVIVICYGSYRVVQGQVTTGELITFYGFLGHLYLPTRRLADASAALQIQLAAMDRVFEVMDVAPTIQDATDARPLVVTEARLDFEDVYFGYNTDQPVLEGLTLHVEPGQSVAIVGRSGAGKTTLVSLVPRFYDVTSGIIRIDGQDIRRATLASLRGSIGMVMQDPILFDATIRENILYGRIGATEEDMRQAARMAHAEEFILHLPRGFDTIIGERGITLSGGQKQRISIARAFLRDPRILILDEATSNLDSHAEQIIQDALEKLMRGRTTLVIAHRLSTVIDCDKVVYMQQGRIVQEGTHDELIATPGPYRDLCEEQFGAVQLPS